MNLKEEKFMSYEYTVDENGIISGFNSSVGRKQVRPVISDKDRDFLEKVIYKLVGDYTYGVEMVADLQRAYGTRLMVGLLNGILNYRDLMVDELKRRKEELDTMVNANEQLIQRVKLLEEQGQQLQNERDALYQQVYKDKILRESRNNLKNEEIDNKIVELSLMGFSQKKIAENLKISNSRVCTVLKNYRAQQQ